MSGHCAGASGQNRSAPGKILGQNGFVDNRIIANGHGSRYWSIGWIKEDGGSYLVHNPDFTPDDFTTALDDAVESVRKLAPTFPKVKHAKVKDGHCPCPELHRPALWRMGPG